MSVKRWEARWALLGTYALLLAGLVAVVPALGSSDSALEAGAPPEFPLAGSIELALPGPDGDRVTTGDGLSISPQSIGLSGKCGLATSPTILSFEPSSVGLVDGSIGIRSKGNGEDCGQLDTPSETLSVSLGSEVGTNLAIYRAELDLEVQQNARVVAVATLGGEPVGTFTLLTGDNAVEPFGLPSTTAEPVSSCNPASSSGPNAAARDNCRWVITPDVPFDSLELSATAGKASLEGGGDGALDGGPGEPSRFLLTQVLDCGDSTDLLTGNDPALTGIITRLDNGPGVPCTPKSYSFRIDEDVIKFEPNLAVDARFTGIITKDAVAGDPVGPSGSSSVPVVWIEYDKDGSIDGLADFVPMQWCAAVPSEGGSDPLDGVADSDGPATWCVYDASYTDLDLLGQGGPTFSATFLIYGEDDPHWR